MPCHAWTAFAFDRVHVLAFSLHGQQQMHLAERHQQRPRLYLLPAAYLETESAIHSTVPGGLTSHQLLQQLPCWTKIAMRNCAEMSLAFLSSAFAGDL